MGTRPALQSLLEEILGSTNVYYQPPESIKLKYPCIIYSLADIYTRKADDRHYTMQKNYSVTVISRDPDNTIAESILLAFPMTNFDRRYVVDNLYHDVITLYYKA
jgi:hypothetical protein